MKESAPSLEARRLLRRSRFGVLATVSRKLEGYPFGSVVPYMTDHEARPLILVSTLAEHTKNIAADPRVSLIAFEPHEDVQAHGRVTVVGEAKRIEPHQSLKARYLRYFPSHRGYFDTHDFFFHRIEPRQVRFIGGFGSIHWIAAETFQPPQNALAEEEPAILAHMNRDHAENLRQYCRHVHGKEAAEVEMIGIDCDGFDVRANGELLRFCFDRPVLDAEGARAALVALAHAGLRAGAGPS